MATSTVSITASKTGRLTGGQDTPAFPSYTNANAPDNITTQAFTATIYAAVTVPSGAKGVIIIPPTSNSGTITFKGVTGDTGVPLHKTQPNAYIFDDATGPAFGLLCSASITIEFWWF
jgi:hypothetical protein